MDVRPDGGLDVTDRRTGQVYRGWLSLVDDGDAGDAYSFSPPDWQSSVSGGSVERVAVAEVGFRAVTVEHPRGGLPAAWGLLEAEPPVEAVKPAEAGRGPGWFVVRLCNTADEAVTGVLRLGAPVRAAMRVDLMEEEVAGEVERGARGEVAVTLRPYEIVSVALRLALPGERPPPGGDAA